MAQPEIDFTTIRLQRGTQATAFEELCCQLAGDETFPQGRVSFDRKGPGGDGGVECFAKLTDGSEVGWQVKYYQDIASAIRSLEESLITALVKHPRMSRFIACLPFDPADSRKDKTTTGLMLWDSWRTERIARAEATGRTIQIERWGAHELRLRLNSSASNSAGRVTYWFDKTLFSEDWFRQRFERARAGLGERYSPESHIDLPIRRVIEASALHPRLFDYLSASSQDLAQLLQATDQEDVAAVNACQHAISAMALSAERSAPPLALDWLRHALDEARNAVLSWHRKRRNAVKPTQQDSKINAISNLSAAITSVSHELAEPYWEHLQTRALLITGEAGSGKSHLLADACDHTLRASRPAILILGNKLPDGEPWEEILKDLGMPGDVLAVDFLGALNAAGEAAGVRTLLMIDGINEKNGQAIWPTRLAGLVHDVQRFEWISLVLSCRSAYESFIVPDELNSSKLPRIKHEGFSERQWRRYLKIRGIRLDEEPNAIEEFKTPLFLRLCCDALTHEDKALIASGLGGVSAVFKLYTDAIVKRVNAQLAAPPQRRFVERAIEALAQEMAHTGREEVSTDRAYALIALVFPDTATADKDLLFQLQNEGLLAVQRASPSDPGEEYRFTFQRMSDHAIARGLLLRDVPSGDVAAAFSKDTALRRAIEDPRSMIAAGLMEALAVQLPEQFGVELADMPGMRKVWGTVDAFELSLLSRRQDAFSERTWALVDEVGGHPLRFDTLIALSTDPGRNLNAEFLDAELGGMSMPARDSTWSTHLAEHPDKAMQLIAWVREADQTLIRQERAALAGLQLCWCLTTSARTVRDTATKALVALLASRPELAISLWQRFETQGDAYVTERLVASIYGAAMQGHWNTAELTAVAQALGTRVFDGADFVPNALTRDHAHGLIRYAISRGALPAGEGAPMRSSAWPIELVPEALIESYVRTYGTGSACSDEIVSSSVFDGDFARYQIDQSAAGWSVALKGSTDIPSAEQLAQRWHDGFIRTATPEMVAAHDALAALIAENAKGYAVQLMERTARARQDFRVVLGEEAYARWCVEAFEWRKTGMFQGAGRARSAPAEFSLAWARRWVSKRAHDLGWSEELHGAFDQSMRSDRHTHSVERIGKKYQWLALYELCARLADNLQPLPGTRESGDVLRLRNIDPSLLVTQPEDDGWRPLEVDSFWIPRRPVLDPLTVNDALEWLETEEDILDGAQQIEVRNPEDERHWLVLRGFESWRGDGDAERDTWRRIGCFVVRQDDLAASLEIAKNHHFQGDDDVPLAQGVGYHSHLGEHPWSWRSGRSTVGLDDEWIEAWRPSGSEFTSKTVSILATTAAYMAEASGYDASITGTVNLHQPAGWLMDGMGLKLTNGLTIQYVDAEGVVRFMDPSVALSGRSAALIDRQAFLEFLAREKLVAIWALAGEKSIFGKGHHGGFGGRWTFTRIFHSQSQNVIALSRYQTFDAPSEMQLSALHSVD